MRLGVVKGGMDQITLFTASARADGNASRLGHRAVQATRRAWQAVDLAALSLPAFHDPRPLPAPAPTGDVARAYDALIAARDVVFAVPIYWYALPAPAKLFLDHWSGFLDLPDFPPAMRAKRFWLITSRADPAPAVTDAITDTMCRTALWLGAEWGGALHAVADARGEVEAAPEWQGALHFLPRTA